MLGDPSGKLLASLAVQATARLPELLDDVVPVDARHRIGEVGLLQTPDVVRAIGEEEAALATVTASDRVFLEPAKEGFVALESRQQALVERPLEAVPGDGAAQHADEGDLRVLALVALLATRALMFAAALSTPVALRPAPLAPGLSAALRLRGRDHRCTPAVHLDDQYLTIVLGHRGRVEKVASLRPDSVDHAKGRTRARCPLMKLGEKAASIAKGEHRAELRDRRHRAQAEAGAQTQLTVDRQIRAPAPPQRAAYRPRERDFAKARADLAVAARRRVQRVARAVVLVGRRSGPRRGTRQEQCEQRASKGQQRCPQLLFRRSQRDPFAFRDGCGLSDRVLDFSFRTLDTARHGVLSGWCSCFATGYLPELSPYFQPARAKRSKSLCFLSAVWELHPKD